MRVDFLGRSNRLLVNSIVWDEGLKLWRVIENGVLTMGGYTAMQDAIDVVDKTASTIQDACMDGLRDSGMIQSTQTPEEIIKAWKIHPSIVKAHLTKPDGTLRIPGYQEWNEDFGMGYANRLAWERDAGEYTT